MKKNCYCWNLIEMNWTKNLNLKNGWNLMSYWMSWNLVTKKKTSLNYCLTKNWKNCYCSNSNWSCYYLKKNWMNCLNLMSYSMKMMTMK